MNNVQIISLARNAGTSPDMLESALEFLQEESVGTKVQFVKELDRFHHDVVDGERMHEWFRLNADELLHFAGRSTLSGILKRFLPGSLQRAKLLAERLHDGVRDMDKGTIAERLEEIEDILRKCVAVEES